MMRRREFVKQVVQSTTVISTALSAKRVFGANDRVVVGLIGCGGRGRTVAELMRAVPGVEFAASCDVYEPNASAAREWAGTQARSYRDFRKLLEQKDIDAVLIATPDHWHAIPTVLACQAGKDVYVEKPLAHNVNEGRAMVTAARRYNRVVQTGTQHRSDVASRSGGGSHPPVMSTHGMSCLNIASSMATRASCSRLSRYRTSLSPKTRIRAGRRYSWKPASARPVF